MHKTNVFASNLVDSFRQRKMFYKYLFKSGDGKPLVIQTVACTSRATVEVFLATLNHKLIPTALLAISLCDQQFLSATAWLLELIVTPTSSESMWYYVVNQYAENIVNAESNAHDQFLYYPRQFVQGFYHSM